MDIVERIRKKAKRLTHWNMESACGVIDKEVNTLVLLEDVENILKTDFVVEEIYRHYAKHKIKYSGLELRLKQCWEEYQPDPIKSMEYTSFYVLTYEQKRKFEKSIIFQTWELDNAGNLFLNEVSKTLGLNKLIAWINTKLS